VELKNLVSKGAAGKKKSIARVVGGNRSEQNNRGGRGGERLKGRKIPLAFSDIQNENRYAGYRCTKKKKTAFGLQRGAKKKRRAWNSKRKRREGKLLSCL